MRRTLIVSILAGALVVFGAGPALAGHCINASKPGEAGTTDVVIGSDGEIVNGIPNGGYADLYMDLDGDGERDLPLAEDVLIGRNHSPQYDTTGEPWVNPGAVQKVTNDNAPDDHGITLPH